MGFLKLLYFDSKISQIIFIYIFIKFKTSPSKCNNREVSIFISFEFIIFLFLQILPQNHKYSKIKHLHYIFFNFNLRLLYLVLFGTFLDIFCYNFMQNKKFSGFLKNIKKIIISKLIKIETSRLLHFEAQVSKCMKMLRKIIS